MAIDVPLIWPSGKANYFLFWGLTRFLTIRSDLPVGRSILINKGFRRREDYITPRRAMTAMRPRLDWLSFHRRKHGQARAKSSKTPDSDEAQGGNSEAQIVEAEGFDA